MVVYSGFKIIDIGCFDLYYVIKGANKMGNVNVNIYMGKKLKGQFESDIVDEKLNKETIDAMNEVKMMEKDPSFGKTYSNIDELMKDLL